MSWITKRCKICKRIIHSEMNLEQKENIISYDEICDKCKETENVEKFKEWFENHPVTKIIENTVSENFFDLIEDSKNMIKEESEVYNKMLKKHSKIIKERVL